MVSRSRKDRRRAAARAALGILGLLLAAGGPVVCGGATGAAADAKSGGPETSELWGKAGEAWTPQSRLPDFSYAGYHCGDDPIPDVPVVANVREPRGKGRWGDGRHRGLSQGDPRGLDRGNPDPPGTVQAHQDPGDPET